MDDREFVTQGTGLDVDQTTTTTTSTATSRQSPDLGSKINEKVDKVSSAVKEKTNRAIESTNRGVDRVAMYFKNKDSQEMMQDLQTTIRKHPGKSVIAGLFLGILVGKVLR